MITMRCFTGIRIIILLGISCDLRDSRQGSKDSSAARFKDSKEIPGAVNMILNHVEPLGEYGADCQHI